jgi:hypothetical protein
MAKKPPPPPASDYEAEIALLAMTYGGLPAERLQYAVVCLFQKGYVDRGWCTTIPKLYVSPSPVKAMLNTYLRDRKIRTWWPAPQVPLTKRGFPESWVVVRYNVDGTRDLFPVDAFMEKF